MFENIKKLPDKTLRICQVFLNKGKRMVYFWKRSRRTLNDSGMMKYFNEKDWRNNYIASMVS